MAGRGTDIKLGGAEESENLEKEMKVSKDSWRTLYNWYRTT